MKQKKRTKPRFEETVGITLNQIRQLKECNFFIIGWGFCDIQNNQGLGKGYQPHSASSNNCLLFDFSNWKSWSTLPAWRVFIYVLQMRSGVNFNWCLRSYLQVAERIIKKAKINHVNLLHLPHGPTMLILYALKQIVKFPANERAWNWQSHEELGVLKNNQMIITIILQMTQQRYPRLNCFTESTVNLCVR